MKCNYAGHVANTGKREGETTICLEAGPRTSGDGDKGTRILGFSLMLVEAHEAVDLPLSERQEIGIEMSEEQMLDLIAALQHQVELAQWHMKQMDGCGDPDFTGQPPPEEI